MFEVGRVFYKELGILEVIFEYGSEEYPSKTK